MRVSRGTAKSNPFAAPNESPTIAHDARFPRVFVVRRVHRLGAGLALLPFPIIHVTLLLSASSLGHSFLPEASSPTISRQALFHPSAIFPLPNFFVSISRSIFSILAQSQFLQEKKYALNPRASGNRLIVEPAQKGFAAKASSQILMSPGYAVSKIFINFKDWHSPFHF